MEELMDHPNRKKFLSLAGFLVFLLIAMVFVVYMMPQVVPSFLKSDKKTGNVNAEKLVEKPVPAGNLPQLFPADLPLEREVEVIKNQNFTNAQGYIQGTRIYFSKLNLDENIKLFNDYFAKQGWQTTSIVNDRDLRKISADKAELHIQVTVSTHPIAQRTVMDISVVKQSVPSVGSVQNK